MVDLSLNAAMHIVSGWSSDASTKWGLIKKFNFFKKKDLRGKIKQKNYFASVQNFQTNIYINNHFWILSTFSPELSEIRNQNYFLNKTKNSFLLYFFY